MSEKTQYDLAEERISEIQLKFESGQSVSAIAREMELRREAVATVLTARGLLPSNAKRQEVLDFVRSNPGLSIDDIALRLNMPKNSVSRYLRGSEEHKLVVSRKQSNLATYSDEDMFEALRTAWRKLDDDGRKTGLSRGKYEKLMAHEQNMPSSSSFIRRWGSWSVSCEKAGISAASARRTGYTREFTIDDIIQAVNEFEDETGLTTYHAYCEWARRGPGRPSGPLLVQRTGGWSTARREAVQRRLSASAA